MGALEAPPAAAALGAAGAAEGAMGAATPGAEDQVGDGLPFMLSLNITKC